MEDVTCTKELRDCTSHNTGNWPEITSAHSSANKDISISNYNVIGHKQTSYNGHTGGDFADTVSCHLAASPHHPKTKTADASFITSEGDACATSTSPTGLLTTPMWGQKHPH